MLRKLKAQYLKRVFFFMVVYPFFLTLFCERLEKRESYLILNEVIPEAVIVCETEGIVEFKKNLYILGLNDLKEKKELIEKLDLLNLEGPLEIDLRYRRQVIIRKRRE